MVSSHLHLYNRKQMSTNMSINNNNTIEWPIWKLCSVCFSALHSLLTCYIHSSQYQCFWTWTLVTINTLCSMMSGFSLIQECASKTMMWQWFSPWSILFSPMTNMEEHRPALLSYSEQQERSQQNCRTERHMGAFTNMDILICKSGGTEIKFHKQCHLLQKHGILNVSSQSTK